MSRESASKLPAPPPRARYRKPPELARLGARHAVVEASAGTGKTYLLEHLVVDLLLARAATIEQILVVTFTEKATAELVDRVRRKLEELCALTGDHGNCAGGVPDEHCWIIDEPARRRLRDAIHGFDRASISTIHAFCQRLLAEHAFANRRLFDEEAIDEEQAFETAFAETLRRDVAPDARLSRYLQLWLSQGGGLWPLRRALLGAARKLGNVHPRTEAALQPAADDGAIVEAGRAFLAVPTDHLKDALKREGIHHSTARALIVRVESLRGSLAVCAGSDDALDWLRALAPLERKLCKELSEKLGDQARSAALADLRAAFDRLEDRSSVLGVVVARLLPVFERRLEANKREAGRYDFQDMLTLVARSLEGEGERQQALLASLRARYRYALIDEFQDTDEVQWSIFRRIFWDSPSGHVLTVIGDPKQAIYSFRGADVHTYLRARQEIQQAGGELLHLAANFRSSAPMIAAYNAVLDDSAPFFRPEGGIHYDYPVTCGRPELGLVEADGQPGPAVVILDVVTEAPNLLTFQVKAALLPRLTAEIAGILRPGGGLRFGAVDTADGDPADAALPPVRAGDIYVLTRTTRESREVGEALREAGIPFAYFKQEKLFGTIEAREVLDVLRAIADPDDATARGRAFITPFFGLGLVDLAACDDLDASAGLYRRLHQWRALADAGDFERLFAELIDGSGIVCRELFFKDSERSLTNYLHLIEILQEETARSRATIRELAQVLGAYIAGTRRPPGDARDIQRLETDADAVQIMTIHHAKGLEAKVVFLYGGFWPGPYTDVRAFHGDAGERVVRVGRPSPADRRRYDLEQDDEERRVLYVALTRAKGRLYLPRFPPAFRKLLGAYRFVDARLHALLGGFSPEAHLFQRVTVPCPAPATRVPSEPPAALLAAWQPPAALLATEPDAGAAARALGQARAGFAMTSYSAIKRRHGGFVPAAVEGDDPSASEAQAVGPAPGVAVALPEGELPRGRLSGLFLHEVLEEVALEGLRGHPPLAAWAASDEVALLFERKRQRHDRRPEHLPHAQRLVYTALTAPLALGEVTIAGLHSATRTLREMEFLYPIPERSHPLLGASAPAAAGDGPWFRIQRGAVKGYIDLLFEHAGRTYVCDWKGDWLPGWGSAELAAHCQRNYATQAQLYTLAALRFLGIDDEAAYQARFGGLLYAFVRGIRADDPRAGIQFQRPSYAEILAWQDALLADRFWGLVGT